MFESWHLQSLSEFNELIQNTMIVQWCDDAYWLGGDAFEAGNVTLQWKASLNFTKNMNLIGSLPDIHPNLSASEIYLHIQMLLLVHLNY